MRRRHLVLVVVTALSAGCAAPVPTGAPSTPSPVLDESAPSTPGGAVQPSDPQPSPTLCAQFPGGSTSPGDLEGFFNATPADEHGRVLTDPSRWDTRLREHPRVALVEVDTGRVVSTYDRVSCTVDDPAYVPPPADPAWPSGGTAVVDMDTGATIDVHVPDD